MKALFAAAIVILLMTGCSGDPEVKPQDHKAAQDAQFEDLVDYSNQYYEEHK